jgi:hypothetical protein
MTSARRASILKLALNAREMDIDVLQGHVERDAATSAITVDNQDLVTWLAKFQGQEVVILVASLDDDRPITIRTCRTCGRDYTDSECPYCGDARRRLRSGHSAR